MRYYIEAYHADGKQILGNLDGQSSLNVRDYRRTMIYKMITNRRDRPKWPRVKYWIVTHGDTAYGGRILERIDNPHHKA